MTACPISVSPRSTRRREEGFTLVELMVALLLSLLLAVAMLKMQSKMASQTVRVSDTGTRDTQARAAMDLITRDLSSSGFLFANSPYACDALFTYNSGASYFVHHSVDALAAVTGTKMNFAPSLTLNYPPAGAPGLASDVLVMTMATSASQFNDGTNLVLLGDGFAGGNPLGDGVLPLGKTTTLVAGDAAIVQAPIGTSGTACMRVPVSAVGPGSKMKSNPGTTMPPGYYNDFVAQVAGAGFGAPLTNVALFYSYVVDIGTKATSTQVTNVYYIDGSGAYPVLMRARYSLVDDTVITTPQPIAAGVVALRTSFGVDPGSTGSVTAYETGDQVTTNHHWSFVRSVRVALVTRTINDDPTSDSTGYVGPTTIPIGPAASGASAAWFSSITVPASQHRYAVNTTEVAYRNWLWRN